MTREVVIKDDDQILARFVESGGGWRDTGEGGSDPTPKGDEMKTDDMIDEIVAVLI